MKVSSCFRLLLGLFFAAQQLHAAVVNKTIYINRGGLTTVMATTLPSLGYNATNVYHYENEVINVGNTDTLKLTIINNDSTLHGFNVKNYAGVAQTIPVGDSITVTMYFGSEGVWIYYDHLNYPDNRYLGLGGMIAVSNSTYQKFYWNIKDHQTGFNIDLTNGTPVNWNNYYPDFHTVNGQSYPELQNHNLAIPNVYVGDTILIFVVNTGQSKRSVHFHGYHPMAQYSSEPLRTNWIKETWPVKSMEGYIWRIVLDKQGEYSVHDHNLLGQSGAGLHHHGFYLIMNVQ